MSQPVERGVLAAIVLVGLLARAHDLGVETLWLDELYSLEASTGRSRRAWPPVGVVVPQPPPRTALEGARPWPAVWTALHEYTHPPLYFLVLRAWRELFGGGVTAARSLSVAASVGALLLLFAAVREGRGSAPALWACALMAAAPPQVHYAQETRGYSLLVLFGLGAGLALLRVEHRGPSPKRVVALGLCTLGALLTHYNGLGLGAALGAYSLLALRGEARRRTVLALAAALAFFLAACGPVAWLQKQSVHPGFWLLETPEGALHRAFARLSALPRALLLAPGPEATPGLGWGLALYLLPWLLTRRRDVFFWTLWLAAPLAFVAAVDLTTSTRQLAFVRFTIVASPAVYALLASPVASDARGLVRHTLPAAALVLCLAGLPEAYQPVSDPWRFIGSTVGLAAGSDGAVLLDVYDPRVEDAAHALLHYAPAPGRPLLLLGRSLPEAARRQLAAADGVWLLIREPHPPPSRLGGATVEDTLELASGWFLHRLSFREAAASGAGVGGR